MVDLTIPNPLAGLDYDTEISDYQNAIAKVTTYTMGITNTKLPDVPGLKGYDDVQTAFVKCQKHCDTWNSGLLATLQSLPASILLIDNIISIDDADIQSVLTSLTTPGTNQDTVKLSTSLRNAITQAKTPISSLKISTDNILTSLETFTTTITEDAVTLNNLLKPYPPASGATKCGDGGGLTA